MNKIFRIIIYILFIVLISSLIYSIYLGDIRYILRGFIHVIFLTSLLLLDKLDGKNKKNSRNNFLDFFFDSNHF